MIPGVAWDHFFVVQCMVSCRLKIEDTAVQCVRKSRDNGWVAVLIFLKNLGEGYKPNRQYHRSYSSLQVVI
jgi:hypothetical protein